MATVRAQTLEEWFLAHQLRALMRSHVYNPITLDAPVDAIIEHFGDAPAPWTALLIKAAALTAKAHPEVNRVVFDTLFGARVVQFDAVHVNVPHYITHKDRKVLIASTISNAGTRSIDEIRDTLREASQKRLEDTVVARRVIGRPNHPINRAGLRLVHFIAYNFPSLYISRGGGGVSVSSLMNHNEPGFWARPISFGPTALTVSATSVAPGPGGGQVLKIGLGFDHLACEGNAAAAAVRTLARVFREPHQALLDSA